MVEPDHLHSTYLKSSGKNNIYNGSYLLVFDCMRLNDAKSAVLSDWLRLSIIIITRTNASPENIKESYLYAD